MAFSTTIKPGEILFGEVSKSRLCEDCGLKICERNGKLFVIRIQDGGLFQQWTPVEAGDQLLAVNDQSVDRLSVDDVNRIFKDEKKVKVKALRAQFGLCDSFTSCTADPSETNDI